MNVTVFCGSKIGNESFKNIAFELGKYLAFNNHNVIYGGGGIGLMGALADGVISGSGNITGIIPELLLKKELATKNLTKLITVKTMHERKALMNDMCEAFIILPGGLGTLEEAFEVWTHAQIGYHKKPIGFLNLNGFYDKLFEFVKFQSDEGFIDKKFLDMVLVESDYKKLIENLQNLA